MSKPQQARLFDSLKQLHLNLLPPQINIFAGNWFEGLIVTQSLRDNNPTQMRCNNWHLGALNRV